LRARRQGRQRQRRSRHRGGQKSLFHSFLPEVSF
jgi:hypothetical protein